MNKTIIVVVVIAVVLLGGYMLLRNSQPSTNETAGPPASQPPANNAPPPPAPQPPAPEETEHVVTYNDSSFSPATLKIKKGETVVFKNQGAKSMWPASAMHPSHRAYAGTSLEEHCPDTTNTSFDACKGYLPASSWSFMFDKTGSWKYHNHLNPTVFGSITVE